MFKMLCCRRQQRDYDVANEEEIDQQRTQDVKGDNLKKGKDNSLEIEPQIEVTVSEVTESVKKTGSDLNAVEQNGTVNKAEDQTIAHSGEVTYQEKGIDKNPKYVSQMSVSSSLSVREEINRSREQFFSNSSLNDSQFQEGSPKSQFQERSPKRLSATDEKFAEYHRKLQLVKAQRLAEENVMSAEQMQQAVSRLEAVAARLESLAVAGVKHGGGSSASASPGTSAGSGLFNH